MPRLIILSAGCFGWTEISMSLVRSHSQGQRHASQSWWPGDPREPPRQMEDTEALGTQGARPQGRQRGDQDLAKTICTYRCRYIYKFCFVLFLQYQGSSPGMLYYWVISPVLYLFMTGSCLTAKTGLKHQSPASASQVTEIIGICHHACLINFYVCISYLKYNYFADFYFVHIKRGGGC